MKSTDTRYLKRGPDGFWRSGAGKKPCDHCAWSNDCPLQPRDRCDLFMAAIPFTDETGLRKIANTVRVGVAWTQRLEIGMVIGLYNSVRKQMFGHARVVGLESGPIAKMLRAHAHANHLMLDTEPNDAAKTLLAWQRRQYGPRIINGDTKITAIYLLRQLVPPAAPDFQRYETDRLAESGAAGPGEDPRD